ncbi:helix-turn-helix transcriptional regulator [Streptomyces sp. JJ36]|uniref:helix-turn-helix domain-containing protein n=1 Tax=Streptomyces sp. JJ36 TaxID=2736645 RepID=UPI001F163B18|nr:helix-turn-helix transcriptional regulator [Streptomyces sp. JJ36]MCF6522412.1 helix-turn-helix domain-containing protein [Streptomyces sp. JJ36]
MRSTQQRTSGDPPAVLPEQRRAGPAVPRMILGARLRALRESQYITRQEAAEAIRTTHAHIVRLELGRAGCRLRDVSDLLTIYSVSDEAERAVLMTLAEQANRSGWWDAYLDVVPEWLHTYLGLEQAADVIRSYEAQFVPGLLQTPGYARAVVELGHAGAPEAQVRRRVELRMRRQQILHDPRPPYLWAVIDEAALRRPIGGTAVMRAQLEHLIAMSSLPHVTVQVLPFHAAATVATGGPVTLVRLPDHGLPDVVYLEQLISAHYPEDPEDIEFHRHVVDRLVTAAEPAARTPALLRRIMREGLEAGTE